MAGKQSKGKQKIEIKRIESEDARQVTFSKRRTGAFKKASELTTLCGADVMLLVFSPAGRPYSFGHPDVDEVIDRFLSPGTQPLVPDMVRAHRANVVHQLNQECAELAKHSDTMRARRAILEERVTVATGGRKPAWKKSGFEAFNLEELQHMSKGLGELKLRAEGRVTEILSGGGASSSRAPLAVSPISTVNPFAVGGLNHHQLCDGTTGFNPKFN